MRFWKQVKGKLQETYRFIIVHNETYEQAGNYTFTVGRFILTLILLSGFLITVTALLIIFTPLREYIPGYTDARMHKAHEQLMTDMEKLRVQIALQDSFVVVMQEVIRSPESDSLFFQAAELLERANASSLQASGNVHVHSHAADHELEALAFRLPIEGKLIKKYDSTEAHFGIDLSVDKSAIVRAAADGTVVFAEYSNDTGHVIVIQHAGDFISVYKHNSKLLKKAGEHVVAGQQIARAGNTGELSTGPHLHFEIWNKGAPVNPLNYLK